jgi:hypothetical protein
VFVTVVESESDIALKGTGLASDLVVQLVSEVASVVDDKLCVVASIREYDSSNCSFVVEPKSSVESSVNLVLRVVVACSVVDIAISKVRCKYASVVSVP